MIYTMEGHFKGQLLQQHLHHYLSFLAFCCVARVSTHIQTHTHAGTYSLSLSLSLSLTHTHTHTTYTKINMPLKLSNSLKADVIIP